VAEVVVRVGWRAGDGAEALLSREWLVANGLGGYATGTVGAVCTRGYHGLLVAALPGLGRAVMLSHLSDRLQLDGGRSAGLGGEERAAGLVLHGAAHLREFRLELGLPVWTYEVQGVVLEKRVLLPHGQNTVHVGYHLLAGEGPVRLTLRPAVHFRPHDGPVSAPLERYHLSAEGGRYELTSEDRRFPPLRLALHGRRPTFTVEEERLADVVYRVEGSRGYDRQGDLLSPGFFRVELDREADVTLVASTEAWETVEALAPGDAARAERIRREALLARAPAPARSGPAAELVLAADAFVVEPAGRTGEESRSRARGDAPRAVIAGYPWFTDWGRDTMISLEGLTLSTGRAEEGGAILRASARHVQDGLVPNLFPEGGAAGLYHTADATLWMFHALDRYLSATGDRATLRHLLPVMEEIFRRHVEGTRFGIGVDPRDGLLRQGAEGHQLTWMDAKCDGWVVTPRRGKAVEINALWYRALRVLERWLAAERGEPAARPVAAAAARVYTSFNRRFWCAQGGYLFDVVDGEDGEDDPSFRPNQLLAVALPDAVLDPARWRAVVEAVHERLLVPVGLRSLSRDHPQYKARYQGDLHTRDAAYHQGTVWSWLLGPFVDAWRKVHPGDRDGALRLTEGLTAHLGEAGLGQISEVFDAEPPFAPGGCVAQAWGVAELLRLLVELGGVAPLSPPGPAAPPR
jgi:predicted glycogen debranching enzyme